MSTRERETLVTLLRQLLVSFEGSVRDGELPLLGLMLAPAHVTIEMRRSLGLPDVVGLLVRHVDAGGPRRPGGPAGRRCARPLRRT